MLKAISLPLILLGILLISYLLWKAFSLPDSEQIRVLFENFFARYGLAAVFIAGVLEGLILVSQYFPGGFLIILGVISLGNDIPQVVAVITVASVAFLVGYYINYLIGKHGFYTLLLKLGFKDSVQKYEALIEKHAFKTIFISNWDSHFASVASTAAGILRLNQKKFLLYSIISIAIWNTLWGTIVYSLGSAAVELVGFRSVLILLSIWIIALLISYFFSSIRKNNKL